jgi:hypothetical protein
MRFPCPVFEPRGAGSRRLAGEQQADPGVQWRYARAAEKPVKKGGFPAALNADRRRGAES